MREIWKSEESKIYNSFGLYYTGSGYVFLSKGNEADFKSFISNFITKEDIINLLEKLKTEMKMTKTCKLCNGTGLIQITSAPYYYVKCYACGGDGVGEDFDGEGYLTITSKCG